MILFYAGTPIRILAPSLWEFLRDLWNVGGDLIHLAAASIAHLGRHLQRFPFAFGYLDEPLWRWQERSTDPDKADGASWVRRKVPWSVLLQNGQEEVHRVGYSRRKCFQSKFGTTWIQETAALSGKPKILQTIGRNSGQEPTGSTDMMRAYRMDLWINT